MKKFILTIVISTGLVGAILTSCLCKNIPEHWMPKSISANVVNFEPESLPYAENDTITDKSIKIELNFDFDYMAVSNSGFNHFGNAAFATQKCPIHGYEGIKYGISSFKLTSNKDFDTIPAGSDLSELLYLNQKQMNTNFKETFNAIDEGLSQGYSGNSVYFIFKDQPSTSEQRYFTLTWTFSNNQKMSCDTQSIVW